VTPDDLTALIELERALPGPPVRWDDVPEVLRTYAHDELTAANGTGLFVAAAAGDEPLLLASSRPYAQGEHHQVVVELASLALGFGADRIAVAVTGRAWSTEDPIAPVAGDVDLRQRVLAVTTADGHERATAQVRGVLFPFELDDDGVSWGDPLPADDGQGWMLSALAVVVTETASFVDRPDDLAAQFQRCDALGHVLDLSPRAVVRLLAATADVV